MPSESNLQHVLITPFLVRSHSPHLPSDLWIKERIRLFERYCLPSVESQTVDNFEWLIFVDRFCPFWLKKYLEQSVTLPMASLSFIDGPLTADRVRESIFARESCNRLLTSRLDNDDALARDFVSRVQTASNNLHTGCINFDYGLQLSAIGSTRLEDLSNPFVSLVEPWSHDCATVLCCSHQEITQRYRTLHVQEKPAWLQVIHDQNLGNFLRSWKPARTRDLSMFETSGGTLSRQRLHQQSLAKALWTTLSRAPLRFIPRRSMGG